MDAIQGQTICLFEVFALGETRVIGLLFALILHMSAASIGQCVTMLMDHAFVPRA